MGFRLKIVVKGYKFWKKWIELFWILYFICVF